LLEVCTIFKRLGCWFISSLIRFSLFLPVLLAGGGSYASDLKETQSLPIIQFSIKPRLCVLNAGEEVCRDELEVKWLAKEIRSLCLYQVEKSEPLRCWHNVTEGTYRFELTARASTDFQLRELDSSEALSNQRFQVVYNEKKYRKVRRNPWSFF